MAYGGLTQGMAHGGHILLGNHEVFHTNGSTPITNFYLVQANHVGSLDQAIKLCLEQHIRHPRNMTQLGTHEQQNHPQP
jgi:hypothetical protein